MRRWLIACGMLLVWSTGEAAPSSSDAAQVPEAAGVVPLRLAQQGEADDEEPTPPAADEPTAPGQVPAAAGADEPGGGGDEPGGTAAGEPEPPASMQPAAALQATQKPAVSYGAGFHIRALFLHPWFMDLFLDEMTPLNSVAFGGEFIRRKGNFDLIGSIDFGFYSPTDGNYLGNGKDPRFDTDYVQFRDLNLLAFAVHFIWHHGFTEWLSLVYGAGVGLGIVLGDLYRISNDPNRCNAENAGEEGQCYPRGMDPARREEFLAANAGTEDQDTPETPHLFKEEDVWPVVPIVHLLVGLNFKISDQFSVRVDGGWRGVSFYMGATGHYFF